MAAFRHYSLRIVIGVVAAAMIGSLFTWEPVLYFLFSVVLIAVLLVSFIGAILHGRSLCELCVQSLPLNPSEQATKYRRRLEITHLLADNKKLMVGYMVLFFGSNALPIIYDPLKYPWIAIQLSVIYLLMANNTHRILQPWCSKCGGGGSDRNRTPEPTPVGVA